MNHASFNTSSLLGTCSCCGSSIYGLTVTTASTEIPRGEIDIFAIWGPSGVFSWWVDIILVGFQKEYLG